MPKIIGIIPARSGSQSVHNKNIRAFHGKPLIAWTIECALASNLDRVIVSTNDDGIKDIALKYGAEVPFIRPDDLSDSFSGIEPVLRHTYEYLKEAEQYEADILVMLLPTSPFRHVNDVNMAIQMYINNEVTSVVSVIKAEANINPHWMLVENGKDIQLFNGNTLKNIQDRRQDLPEAFIRNDFVYVLTPKNLYELKPNLYGDSVKLFKISENRYDIDINTEKDFLIAEAIFDKLEFN
jgi:CMP-N,N'-diacetyllegionaminic acid synthase